jgi:Fic family protein
MMKLTAEGGGKWKPSQNEIVEKLSDGTRFVRFKPVAPWETPACLYGRALSRYREAGVAQANDPLILTPLFVLYFLCVHPFSDGNGRMSRLLTVLLLYHHGYEVGRFIRITKDRCDPIR